jgi:light-regulated signal transduction histidine kinase (bacteriophytochrome)
MMNSPSPQKIEMPEHDQLDKLIVDVVHKMKNNLGGITGFASLLERDFGEDKPEGKLVGQIKTSALRLDDLILDLMTLIRQMHISTEILHLLPILQAKLAAYEDDYGIHATIHNKTNLSGKDLFVESDSMYLGRLINSLLTFIIKSQASLTQIVISGSKPLKFCLEFYVQNIDLDFSQNENFTDLINQHEPVEARLAFYTAIKLADQLNCEIALKPIGKNELVANLIFI